MKFSQHTSVYRAGLWSLNFDIAPVSSQSRIKG